MKITYTVAPKNELSFPLLARAITSGMIVLFTGPSTGCIVSSNIISDVGTHSNSWTLMGTPNAWEILPKGSTVVLTQD